MTEENKGVAPSPEETKPEKEKKEKGVSKKEFAEFQNQVTSALGSILERLESQPKLAVDSDGIKVAKSKPEDDGGIDKFSMVPPAWRKLTDEILGPDFDIELDLPENGGQRFVVYVPRDKSNATKDHWERHRIDKRTRELGNTGVRGVKDWLLRIRKNIIASGIKLPYYEDTDPRVGIMIR